MKYTTYFLSLFVLLLAQGIGISLKAQSSLTDELTGVWQGKGTLMGSEATFDMRWEKELNGQFIRLSFESRRTPGGQSEPVIFKAQAMYRPEGENWNGTWFDNRGVSFPLKGKAEAHMLTVDWGSEETELGRTVYEIQTDGVMKVTDFILQNGDFMKFGEATYQRADQNLNGEEGQVIGIGGIFFKSKNPVKTREWYRKHLGVISNERGGSFVWRKFSDPEAYGFTVWHLMGMNDPYFNLSDKEFMVNYRVDNLDALIEKLKANGVELAGQIEEYPFGKFTWIRDPDGQKIELWEPNDVVYLEMIREDGAQLHNASN